MIAEAWKTVPSVPNVEASTEGRVRNAGRVLVPFLKNGYLHVELRIVGYGRRLFSVHRLVCEAFNGRPPPGAHCRHLNDDQSDNRPENLRWGTPAQNAADYRANRAQQNYLLRKAALQNNLKLAANGSLARREPGEVMAIWEQREKGASLRFLSDNFGIERADLKAILAAVEELLVGVKVDQPAKRKLQKVRKLYAPDEVDAWLSRKSRSRRETRARRRTEAAKYAGVTLDTPLVVEPLKPAKRKPRPEPISAAAFKPKAQAPTKAVRLESINDW